MRCGGLAAQRLQRGQLALARDHLFDARHAERPDQLVLEVDDAHPDAVLGTGRRAMAQRPGEPRGLPEIAQATQAHTAPRPPPDVVADVRRTAHRDHRDAVGREVVAAAAGQLDERGAIAHALDQHDGTRQDLLRHVPIVPFRSPRILPTMTGVRFRDLGPLQVERAGAAQAVGGARLEAALALLLIHAGQAVSADALAEAMWGGQGGTRSATTLDSHIWRLRKVLEPERAPGSPPTVLLREPGGYRLVVAADRIDSARYTALAAEAGDLLADGAAARALRCAEEAGALWRGRPYGAAADRPWAAAATARLEEIRGRLRETHVGALLATGAAERALTELEAALAEEPLRERLWASRMVAYRDLGRRSDALATYAEARAALVDELGIEPGPELRALHAQLLRDDAGARRPSATHTLPATRSRLVGRDRELAAVLARLGADPLCTLVGAAGCGKTRLAVEVARQAAPGYPDGAWFVDLTSASPDRVLDTVASTLGLPLSGPADPTEALRRYTSARRMLVVLDNCEHVLDAAAELVDALLVGGSTLSVLATSREPLEVDGEQVVGLTPLPVPAAVELFLERLDAPPPADALDSVREIVAAVDGLPLALELAAARARAFTLTEIAADVRVDASALSRVGRGRTHHRTVREAIDSSYRDLPRPLAALHRAVGAVPGPFTAGLAAGLVAADVTNAVAGLAHRSLLTPLGPARSGGASRFAQLATVRGHANHLVERAGEDPAGPRNAWVARLVCARPAMGSARHVGWFGALDDDLAALRATLQDTLVEAPSAAGVAVAARLAVYWAFNGMAREGERWLRTAIGRCAADPGLGRPAQRAAVRVDIGSCWAVQGHAAGGPRADPGRDRRRGGCDGRRRRAALRVAGHGLGCARARGRRRGAGGGRRRDPARRRGLGRARGRRAARRAGAHHGRRAAPGARRAVRGAAPGRRRRGQPLHGVARRDQRRAPAARRGPACDALTWSRSAVRAAVELGQRDNAYVLEVHGAALGRAGEHLAALRVFGAVDAQHRGAGVPWPWDEGVGALLAAMTAPLGPALAEQVREEGARATLAELADT